MAILGKDLFNYKPDIFQFTALFATDGIEIEGQTYKYGEITTAFLNYDCTSYSGLMDKLKNAGNAGDVERYKDIAQQANSLIIAMPLFRDQPDKHQYLEIEFFNPFLQEEPSDPLRNLNGYLALTEDLLLIRQRYAWFLTEIFYRHIPKHDTDRYAWQIEENGMSAFVSGRSLGQSRDVDPATTTVQYELRITDGIPRLYEKMNFARLIDFIYTDLFKGLMYEHVPKRCKLCGKFFLQEKGFSYEYCDGPAPDAKDKTCREIGALSSFRAKVQGSEIWKIHQRAYKKYYARVMKKKMLQEDFNAWALRAEQLRDEALKAEHSAKRMNRPFDLDAYAASLNEL